MSRTLLEQWRDMAYDEKADRGQLQKLWASYFQIEKEIYEQLLSNPELAEKLINGKKTPLSECVPESGADW